MSAEINALAACPEHWQLFELVTEGTTELNAHVRAHVESGCGPCNKKLGDIKTLERARVMKDEFDAFFEELPADDAPAGEREAFLSQFKRKSRPADRLGRLSYDGRQVAGEIVKLAGEQGIDAAKARIAAAEGDPARGYAYLYAAQLAMPKVSSDPAMYVELAKALAAATRSLPLLKDKGPAQPVCREQVVGEAQLLESNALNYLGKCAESRKVAQKARVSFVEAGEDSFALALADYFEGSAASFEFSPRDAWRLLRSALEEFRLYGQENWQGRAEAALGVLLLGRGSNTTALRFLDEACTNLHPERDATAFAAALVNRGYALVNLRRYEAAKATYAKALLIARRLEMNVPILIIRNGLATIELESGRVFRALDLFERLAKDAHSAGIEQRATLAKVRAAECHGRMGNRDEMLSRLRDLRSTADAAALAEHEPALRDLFAALDEPSLSHEHLSHVARFMEARDRGSRAAYRPFKLVANGN